MSMFFFDSSALVKRYLTETGSDWIDALLDPNAGHTVIIANITQVEVAAALAARHRAPRGLTRQERDSAVDLLAQHCLSEYQLVPVTNAILARAVELTQNHRLRGYDAIQLATALEMSATLVSAALAPLTVVSADEALNMAARAENLSAEDPNSHP